MKQIFPSWGFLRYSTSRTWSDVEYTSNICVRAGKVNRPRKESLNLLSMYTILPLVNESFDGKIGSEPKKIKKIIFHKKQKGLNSPAHQENPKSRVFSKMGYLVSQP